MAITLRENLRICCSYGLAIFVMHPTNAQFFFLFAHKRYANEDLRVRASSIAAAAAVAEQPGMGGGRAAWAELGARMADLIASDFEALEAAGLRYGTCPFRSGGGR